MFIAEKLGVKFLGGLAGFVLVLIRLVEEHGVGTVDGPAGFFVGSAGEVVGSAGLGLDLIGTKTGLGEKAVAHGIGESADVAGGGEDGLVGEDGSVESEDIIAFLDVFAPPEVFKVALEFSAKGAVVPASVQATVEFGGLEDEAFTFTQRNDFLHAGGVGLVFISHRFEMLVERAARKQEESQSGKGFLGNPLARGAGRKERFSQ